MSVWERTEGACLKRDHLRGHRFWKKKIVAQWGRVTCAVFRQYDPRESPRSEPRHCKKLNFPHAHCVYPRYITNSISLWLAHAHFLVSLQGQNIKHKSLSAKLAVRLSVPVTQYSTCIQIWNGFFLKQTPAWSANSALWHNSSFFFFVLIIKI